MPGYKTWVDLEELEAADLMTYLMDQVVPRFEDSGDRDAALASPDEGQLCYVEGDGFEIYDGDDWVPVVPAARLLPAGGTTGQVLAKASNDDYDVEWVTP